MIPLEALPGFMSWGRNLDAFLARPEPIWVHGTPGSGVSHVIRELGQRRGTAFLDDADQASPLQIQQWLSSNPRGILGAHCGPGESPTPPQVHRCLPLRLWAMDDAPEAIQPCLEALAEELGVPLPLPPALGLLPCPGNLLELHNRVLSWKLLGQIPEKPASTCLPLDIDSVAANLHTLERLLLHRALRRSYGNRTEAALRLGISRRQLYLLIGRHGDPVRGSLPVAPPPRRFTKKGE